MHPSYTLYLSPLGPKYSGGSIRLLGGVWVVLLPCCLVFCRWTWQWWKWALAGLMTVPTSSGEAAAWRWVANRKPVPGGSVLGDVNLLVSFRKPVVCGVSSLGIDHTSLLGDTVEKIAWQKGGIFKVTAGRAGEVHGGQVPAICAVWLCIALPV